ncbi:hypothetical protein HPP92_028799 [Vanilla planifolia]|uniref:Uncharacterized protein n=1 Tax=Vanilla planifolia TaxID=51239 RepID=A0A835P4S4_VANPL|nr:hypothetical protein HPP92_028799 [Vanilla planifolia]KAG0446530.1 hypothetical protein HPP92_028788 [Vanilla planifolia]
MRPGKNGGGSSAHQERWRKASAQRGLMDVNCTGLPTMCGSRKVVGFATRLPARCAALGGSMGRYLPEGRGFSTRGGERWRESIMGLLSS